jgi:2-iminobutanoate/2-iminopropanoate deaminase
MVYSSAVSGADSENGNLPDDPAAQVRNTFRNVRLLVEAAGGTVADIARMTVYLRDLDHRQFVNDAWLEMFPDEDDRPARHTQRADIAARFHIQIEFVAVLEAG